jgi:hypothetical protein
MYPATDPPPGLIVVPLSKAVLLLTEREYLAGLRRGKVWRRKTSLAARQGEPTHGDREAPA